MKKSTAGWGSGLLGVILFSGSLPADKGCGLDAVLKISTDCLLLNSQFVGFESQ
jgi:hypothetical protein